MVASNINFLYEPVWQLGGAKLSTVHEIELLGVTFTNDLKTEKHAAKNNVYISTLCYIDTLSQVCLILGYLPT